MSVVQHLPSPRLTTIVVVVQLTHCFVFPHGTAVLRRGVHSTGTTCQVRGSQGLMMSDCEVFQTALGPNLVIETGDLVAPVSNTVTIDRPVILCLGALVVSLSRSLSLSVCACVCDCVLSAGFVWSIGRVVLLERACGDVRSDSRSHNTPAHVPRTLSKGPPTGYYATNTLILARVLLSLEHLLADPLFQEHSQEYRRQQELALQRRRQGGSSGDAAAAAGGTTSDGDGNPSDGWAGDLGERQGRGGRGSDRDDGTVGGARSDNSDDDARPAYLPLLVIPSATSAPLLRDAVELFFHTQSDILDSFEILECVCAGVRAWVCVHPAGFAAVVACTSAVVLSPLRLRLLAGCGARYAFE